MEVRVIKMEDEKEERSFGLMRGKKGLSTPFGSMVLLGAFDGLIMFIFIRAIRSKYLDVNHV